MSSARLFFSLMLLSSAAVSHAAEDAKPRVAVLMFDGVQIIDFAGPYEVFGQAGFDVFTVSRDGKPVTTAMNLQVQPTYRFDDAPSAEVVVVPGGHVVDAMKDPSTLDWLRRASGQAEQVMSVCTGSFIVASTGMLDGHAATTFHNQFDAMATQFPEVTIVRDQRWVDAGKIVTSAGLASGIDTALHVVARLRGEQKARDVAMHLEYAWSPSEGFVRGLMADQFLRMPAQPLDLPEGTKIDEVRSYGDARHWEKTWQIDSTLAPAELLA